MMLQKLSIAVLIVFGALQSAAAAGFSCKKPKTDLDRTICSGDWLSTSDEQLSQAYRAARLHSPDRVALRKAQRQLLARRDACQSASCVTDLSSERTAILSALAQRQESRVRPSGPCYVLRDRDADGKRIRHEPVCQAMKKNLNQFCQRPPMVCALQVAPAWQQKIRLPRWTTIAPDRALVERVLRGPWQGNPELDRITWEDNKDLVDQAAREGRLSLARADLDLYNEGKPRQMYRVDFGDCRQRNAQLADRIGWSDPVQPAPVQMILAPEEFAVTSRIYAWQPTWRGEVFTFDKRIYSYTMFGAEGSLNGIYIQRTGSVVKLGDRQYLNKDNICTFDYYPPQ